MHQHIQHKPWIAKQIDFKQTLSLKTDKSIPVPTVFTFKSTIPGSLLTNEKEPLYLSYYHEKSYTWYLYENVGKDNNNNPIYVIIPTKGEANAKRSKVLEYNYDGNDKTIFDRNKVPNVDYSNLVTTLRNRIDLHIINPETEGVSGVERVAYQGSKVARDMLAEQIEDKIIQSTNNLTRPYWALLEPVKDTPFNALLSDIISKKLKEIGNGFKAKINNEGPAGNLFYSGNKVLGIELNPHEIINQFNRDTFETDEEYLDAVLNHNIIHEGLHGVLIPISQNKQNNSVKVNAILSHIE